MLKITKGNAASILTYYRYQADQIIENAFGDVVYLKQGPGYLTECCLASDPCAKHSAIRGANHA